ncbi:MAG: DUF1513 domain-containing protein [Pseudomonadota bacterium]
MRKPINPPGGRCNDPRSPRTLLPNLSRRGLLRALPGALLAAQWPRVQASPLTSTGPGSAERWLSACGDSSETFGLGWLDAATNSHGRVGGGFRGHAVLPHPSRRKSVLYLARRPGTQALEIDTTSGKQVAGFTCESGKHLLGHGCFSLDGRALFTTEADIDSGAGLIVVRDAADYRVLAQWSSGGVGPHDLCPIPDGKTLVVANGGILTHPDSARQPLNLDTMRSSLTYIDTATGRSLGEFLLEEPKSSIRHLAVGVDGTVAFGVQLQRQVAQHNRPVPLTGLHRPGAKLELLPSPDTVTTALHDYIGSVAICSGSGTVGFTSPRGNVAAFWRIRGSEFAGYHRLRDVCGIAVSPARQAFVLSNSFGELRQLDTTTLRERREERLRLPGYRWDNHLLIMETT